MKHQSETEALREENRRLRRAVDELSTLNELARAIGASFSAQEVVDEIIRRSVKAVDADQATITLLDRHAPGEARTLVRAMGSSAALTQFHLDQALLSWISARRRPLLSNDPARDERLGPAAETGIRSLLCVPLMAKSELVGALTAYNKRRGEGFSEEDQRLLGIIASQSAQVVENARLYEEERSLREMQEELRLARRIQEGLLPRRPPEIPGYAVAGFSRPAREVGGDYYDTIPMDGGRWALCLGDVSGKGLPASLLMANLQGTLRAQAASGEAAGACVARANLMLHRSTGPDRFATLIYAVLDAREHRICYCNAGHEPPLLYAGAGVPRRLRAGGMLAGFMEDAAYEDECIDMAPGDFVVAYSDGITDAENALEEPFGEDRLLDLLNGCRDLDPADTVREVVAAVDRHCGKARQFDDLTLIVLKRNS